MKQGLAAFLTIALSVAGIFILNSAYTVDQTEQAVITQFGQPVKGPVKTPGLHWRTPFLQQIHKFDNRVLEWDGDPSEVPTQDKKFIWVDVTGRWRIDDPLQFLQTMQGERNAQSRLDDIMDGITRNFITRHDLVDVVRNSNRILEVKADEADIATETDYEKIKTGRDSITRNILEAARKVVKEYGIELIDLRIKRINYIASVQQKVFERMVSERKRSAEQMRSEGEGLRAGIMGQLDKELKRITSEAYYTTQKLKGQADQEAADIYAGAYSKDPDFYAFQSALERYPEMLKDSRMVLTTASPLLRYLKDGGEPSRAEAAAS